jgi:hypothetical protein
LTVEDAEQKKKRRKKFEASASSLQALCFLRKLCVFSPISESSLVSTLFIFTEGKPTPCLGE